MKDLFVGPSAVAFSNEDVVAPAKLSMILRKMLKHLKSKVVQSKVLFLQKKKSLPLLHCQTAKDFFLCSFLYFKHQFAMLHLLSKQLQTTKKTTRLNAYGSLTLQTII